MSNKGKHILCDSTTCSIRKQCQGSMDWKSGECAAYEEQITKRTAGAVIHYGKDFTIEDSPNIVKATLTVHEGEEKDCPICHPKASELPPKS